MKLSAFIQIISFSLVVILSGCSKYKGESEQYIADGVGNGAQVVPVSASTATGSMTGGYSSTNNTLSGIIQWNNLSGPPTGIHFHGFAMVGRNNIAQFIMVKVPSVATGSLTFQSVFTQSQQSDLINGLYYYDIHTAAFPNGEIRGQIFLH